MFLKDAEAAGEILKKKGNGFKAPLDDPFNPPFDPDLVVDKSMFDDDFQESMCFLVVSK